MHSGLVARPIAVAARQALRRTVPCASSSVCVRSASEWLQGRPPAVSHNAGTVAAFYYKHIREFDIPTKDFVAAYGQDVKMTVAQFDKQVYAYAIGMLEAWNLKKGHKIAVWCTNELESVVAQYAAALIGSEVVVIDPALGFAAVKQLINSESIRALILSPRFGSEDRHTAVATEFEPELAYTAFNAGYKPIESKRFRSLKYIACTGKEFVDGVMRFNELPVYGTNGSYDADDVAALQTYIEPGQAALTYYSAGANGAAVKTRTVSHKDLLASAGATAKSLGLTGSDVVLSTAPVWTFAGLSGAFLAAGVAPSKVVLPGKVWSTADTLKAAELHRPTVVVTTPEHAAALSAEAAKDAAGKKEYAGALDSLRAGLLVTPTGSAPAAPAVLGKAKLTPVDAAKGL